MKRSAALRLQATLATAALAAATGLVVSAPSASAATGSATGYATQNGGTTGGAGGQTVRATTGTAIHAALCDRADSSTPIIIEVQGTIHHGNTSKVSDGNCTPQNPDPTDPTDPTDPPTGANLSLGAGADGSSKARGTSYGNVIDGSLGTSWSPNGSTGSVSVKWSSAATVSKVNVREASGSESVIRSWRLLDHDTGAVLASGGGAGVVSFARTSLRKITFEITGSSGTPRIAEFETYNG
ncbi:hypothetical protein WJ438_10640 [Streptomyces sp. GD-15H]|uniref:hypothetical protein n=1 Tax=Streptomyces sp. GD-15H TaxID=3129112 RepID=UPI003244AE47